MSRATMYDPQSPHEDRTTEPSDSSLATSIVLLIALTVLIVAFVWFVMRLDPVLSDFIEGTQATPTVTVSSDGT